MCMIKKISISSLDHEELAPYRTLRQPIEHLRKGMFIAEGEKVVRRLIESQIEILSVLITPEWLEHYQPLLDARNKFIQTFVANKSLLESIVGYHLHQGIMALGKIPRPENIDSVLARSPHPWIFVAVDGLTNSENLGVLVRNCTAFGVQALFVGETSSSPYLRRAVRNSMGTVFKLPVVQCDNFVKTLKTLKTQSHCTIIAAHPYANGQTIQQANFINDCCIIFGSEGNGISSPVLSVCDVMVAIPMSRGVDSLNVASASAVFLYEITRQRIQSK